MSAQLDDLAQAAVSLRLLGAPEEVVDKTKACLLHGLVAARAGVAQPCVAQALAVASPGTVVVMNRRIHAARDVHKAHAGAVDAFSSGELGVLGWVDDDGVTLARRPLLRRTYPARRVEPRVGLITMAAGDDGSLVRAAQAAGVAGLVVAGSGRGNVTPGMFAALRDVRSAGIPVVVATRTGAGTTLPQFRGEGGASALVDLGCVLAGTLSPLKARILLMILLGLPANPGEIARAFSPPVFQMSQVMGDG